MKNTKQAQFELAIAEAERFIEKARLAVTTVLIENRAKTGDEFE